MHLFITREHMNKSSESILMKNNAAIDANQEQSHIHCADVA